MEKQLYRVWHRPGQFVYCYGYTAEEAKLQHPWFFGSYPAPPSFLSRLKARRATAREIAKYDYRVAKYG